MNEVANGYRVDICIINEKTEPSEALSKEGEVFIRAKKTRKGNITLFSLEWEVGRVPKQYFGYKGLNWECQNKCYFKYPLKRRFHNNIRIYILILHSTSVHDYIKK
jgi:hypothetical protein